MLEPNSICSIVFKNIEDLQAIGRRASYILEFASALNRHNTSVCILFLVVMLQMQSVPVLKCLKLLKTYNHNNVVSFGKIA